MVALLRPNTLLPTALPSRKTPIATRHLRLVEAATPARFGPVGRVTPSIALGVTLALMFLLTLAGLRAMQGTPPVGFELPASEAGVIAGSTGVLSPQVGDILVTVSPGQNMWDVARSVRPDGDVRALVVALAEHNGGSSLRVGQELVIPAHLMG